MVNKGYADLIWHKLAGGVALAQKEKAAIHAEAKAYIESRETCRVKALTGSREFLLNSDASEFSSQADPLPPRKPKPMLESDK